MTRLLAVLGIVSVTATGAASAALTPGRTVTEPTRITALGVTSRTVVYAIDENDGRTRCAAVRLWNTATRALLTFGESTTRVCREGVSTGSGIAGVATSGTRVFWTTFVGGNTRESTLWTATPGRRSPRRLADASTDADADERPLVLGPGTDAGVAYAVRDTVTYVADDGRRLFRVAVGSPVRVLAAGIGPGQQRVVAALADGRVVVLSATGTTVRTIDDVPADVEVVLLALPGPVLQAGAEVRVGARTVTLPDGARLLDFRQGALVYAQGNRVRARRVSDGADTLLRVVPTPAGRAPLFSTDAWGSAWASGGAVSWRGGPLG